eukprot:TRINITY_DN37178_c0_g1_i1.p1 TRINITY_DN37178_c0_g1~~TRINITY_DN37178_c0_g1_i1.p1  ORF type:complete len:231 (+),score=37.26 TRINITY_DN37178_c0_g1_i1:37-693(+)
MAAPRQLQKLPGTEERPRRWPLQAAWPLKTDEAEEPKTRQKTPGMSDSRKHWVDLAVLATSLLLPTLHFVPSSLSGLSQGLTWKALASGLQMQGCNSYLHCAWCCELVVVVGVALWTAYCHGPSKSWTQAVWDGLLARLGLLSLPLSWIIVWLYFDRLLSKRYMHASCQSTYGYPQDVAMATLTMAWCAFLTIVDVITITGVVEDLDEDDMEFWYAVC